MGSGAQLDKRDGHGNTPLIIAAREANYTIVRMLLLEGANPNKWNHIHETALQHVAAKGNHDTVVDLLSCHADPNLQDNKGQNALLLAAKNSRTNVVQTLIENGSDIFNHDSDNGRSALHWAVVNNNTKLATLLIQAGIDLNSKDKNWQTPFMLALTTGKNDTAMLLLNAGCDVTITDKARNTSLHLAARDGRNDLIRSLIKAGINVDIKGAGGATPLMLAAYGGHGTLVHRLLGYGADPDLGDRNWATAIMYCMFSSNDNKHIQAVIKELVRANCNLNQKTQLLNFARTLPVPAQFVLQLEDRMYRPVECSLLRGKMAVFVLLLKAGCDVNGVNGDKLLMQTYLYDAGVPPKHRRLMLRYLAMEKRRVKTLIELCRRPLRIMLNARGLSRSIALLPISDKLRAFLNYEDLDIIEEEMSNDNLPNTIKNWGSSSSLMDKLGAPKSPSSSYPLSPNSLMSPRNLSGSSSPTIPMSPGGDTQHLRRFLDEIPAVKPDDPTNELVTDMLDYGSEEQIEEDYESKFETQMQAEENEIKKKAGIKKALPRLDLSKVSNDLDNKSFNHKGIKDTLNGCDNKIFEENNNHTNTKEKHTNLSFSGDKTGSNKATTSPKSPFSRSNPLRHTISRIPRSATLQSPTRMKSPTKLRSRDDNDRALSPSSTDSSFSSLSFSTEEDLQIPSKSSTKSPTSKESKTTFSSKPSRPVKPFSRMSATRRTFNTTRDTDKTKTPGTWARFSNKT